jgi:DNA-binding NarL/FixJ family response regulator
VSCRRVAERLHTTPRTVYFHISSLFAKLGARSRTEMLYLARKKGWFE